MDDNFDILSLLEEKSKEQLINDAINALAVSGFKSKNEPELSYKIVASNFKRWLVDKGFMIDFFEDDEIKDSDIDVWVKQAAHSFVYYGWDF